MGHSTNARELLKPSMAPSTSAIAPPKAAVRLPAPPSPLRVPQMLARALAAKR